MDKGEAIVSFAKLSATMVTSGVAISPAFDVFNSYISTPVWGVPVTVIGAATFGAAISLFFGDPLKTRKELFGQVIASAFFGAGGAVLLSDAMDWTWAEKNIAMFAMMSAAVIRWFLPTIIERGKQFIREFKFSFTRKGDGGDK